MKYQELNSDARIQFARNIVMMGDELHKRLTMDDAVEWLAVNGEFVDNVEADGSRHIVLTEACREKLSTFLFKSI